MIIDNGENVHLSIYGVFDGYAGLSRGVLAFKPNRTAKNATSRMGALLNGEPVMLEIKRSENAEFYTAKFEALA